MNVHETTEIRELTATELDHVSGGHLNGIEWMIGLIGATWTLALGGYSSHCSTC